MTRDAPHTDPTGPPGLADRFLGWFCPDELLEDIQGDLHELHQERVETLGRTQAVAWYWWNVVWFMRPYVLSGRSFRFNPWSPMWKNYSKVAWRQIRRQPLYSGINVFGLALGIASCILMFMFLRDELTFDRLHTRADGIYRIVEERTTAQGDVQFIGDTAGPVGTTLVDQLPEVTGSTRILDRTSMGRFTLRNGDNERHEGEYLVVQPNFLTMFDFPMLAGDRATALDQPSTMVLTESAAAFYFGHTDVVGESLFLNNGDAYTVTGLMADPPANSHLQFTMLMTSVTLDGIQGWRDWMANWESTGFVTYVELASGASGAGLASKIRAVSDQARGAEAWADRAYVLQPLTEIHFGSTHILREHNVGKSTRAYVFVFSAVSVLIALIACINYMNLSTARALKRAKEVGLRKVVGARWSQLVGQFLGESFLTALLALTVALIMVAFLLPAFNAFTGKELGFNPARDWPVLLGVLGTTLVVGFVSGSYPAFFVARFNPVDVFRRMGGGARQGRWMRQGLVVTQFVLSIVLVVATLGAARQFAYIQGKDLGYNQERLLVLDINSGASRNSFAAMKDGYRGLAAVEAVAVSSRIPSDWKGVPLVAVRAPESGSADRVEATFMGVDADFLDTYQISLAAGRNFSEEFPSDSTALLVNRAAASLLGIGSPSEQPVDVFGLNRGGQWTDLSFNARVVGIVEDFHFQSLHEPIRPIILGFRNNPIQSIDYFTVRFRGTDTQALLAQITAIHQRFDPDTPVEANFLESRLTEAYREDRRAGTVFGLATGLALLIACFGLFGLAAYIAEQRTKEIGVRKVMGASVPRLVLMMSATFTRLVGVAFLLAAPLAWWLTDNWLDSFAYRVEVGLGTLFMAGVSAMLLAWLTVGYQALRAASADPARVLRYE